MNPTDIKDIIQGLRARFQKDSLSIATFQAVVIKKGAEMVLEPAKLVEFATASARLSGDWAAKAADVAKNPFKYYIFDRDPFKGLRAQTRVFAVNWGLDPAFLEVIGK
jgi:hypothetical protein